MTSPFGIVVNSTRSPASAGAVTVIATSHSFGPTPEPSTTPALAKPDFGGSTGDGGGGGGATPGIWAASGPGPRRGCSLIVSLLRRERPTCSRGLPPRPGSLAP